MSEEQSPLVPEWERLGVKEDDSAEPEDAEVTHEASVEEVKEVSNAVEEDEDNE